jgi:hypothetical protein
VIICGINLTHDGSVAPIEEDRLRFSIEVEKLDNAQRYADLADLDRIVWILHRHGLQLTDVDRLVVDGWHSAGAEARPVIHLNNQGRPVVVPMAPYADMGSAYPVLHRYAFQGVPESALARGYSSYAHVSNHVIGGYCTSGPGLNAPRVPSEWSRERCDESQVAARLFDEGKPIVVLDGRAELGPRALGKRSILAPAVKRGMKDQLNALKGRAHYRPWHRFASSRALERYLIPGHATRTCSSNIPCVPRGRRVCPRFAILMAPHDCKRWIRPAPAPRPRASWRSTKDSAAFRCCVIRAPMDRAKVFFPMPNRPPRGGARATSGPIKCCTEIQIRRFSTRKREAKRPTR